MPNDAFPPHFSFTFILLLMLLGWQQPLSGQQSFRQQLDRVDSLLDEDEFELAIGHCERIATEAREAEAWEAFFEAYYSIGYALHYQRKITDFLTYEEELLPYLHVNDVGVLDMLLLLGNAHRNNEDIYEADKYYTKSIQRINHSFPEATDSWLDANINKGVVLIQLSDFEEAKIYLRRVLNYVDSLLQEGPQNYYIGVKSKTHADLAQVYRYLEEKEECLYHYEKRIATLGQIGARRLSQVRSLLNLAEALIFFDEKVRAREILEQILEKDPEYRFERGRAFRFLAEIHWEEADYERAYQMLDSAASCYAAYPERLRFRARLSQMKGKVQLSEGKNPELALSSLQHALDLYIKNFHPQKLTDLPIRPKLDNGRSVFDCLRLKAKAWEALYDSRGQLEDLREAYATYRSAVQLMDSLRSELKNRQSKYFWGEGLHEVLEMGISLCQKLYKLEKDEGWINKAYEFSMAGKAFTLKEKLLESYLFRQDRKTDSLFRIEVSLARKMGQIRQSIDEEENEGAKKEKENRLFALRQLYLNNRKQMNRLIPEAGELFASSLRNDLSRLQAQLASDQQVWEYFWGENRVYAFAVGRKQLSMKELGHGNDLLVLLDSFSYCLSDPDWVRDKAFSEEGRRTYARLGHQLYQALRASDHPPAKLRIIPDGYLSQLPFSCLLTALPDGDRGYGDFPFLLDGQQISYAFAAQSILRASPAAKGPVYLGFAPSYESDLPAIWTRGSVGRGGFGPLNYNQQEVEQAQAQLGGKKLLGAEADKNSFLNMEEAPGILHLALHAFANDSLPMYAGLAFHQGASVPEDGSNILFAYEISQLKLGSHLAILSACQTARGRFQKGEGVLSLARSFMEAGSQAVLMTQWSIDDQATSQLINVYLSKLKEGMDKDLALQEAKKEFLSSFDRNHPYYWGGLVLLGEEEAIFRQGSQIVYYFIPIGLILGLIIFIIYRKRET